VLGEEDDRKEGGLPNLAVSWVELKKAKVEEKTLQY
jgi:hypothetical protein